MAIFNTNNLTNLDELNILLIDKALESKFSYEQQSLMLVIVSYINNTIGKKVERLREYRMRIEGVKEIEFKIDDHVEIYIDHIEFSENKLSIVGVNGCLVAYGEQLVVRVD